MAKLPLLEIGQPAFYFISTANRVIVGNNITEYVQDRLVSFTLQEVRDNSYIGRFKLYRHEVQGTALMHYFNDELCDVYSDMYLTIGYDGTIMDILDYDFIKDKWKYKRADILKKYSSEISLIVDGTSLLLENKEKFINSLFGGYGFWRFFQQQYQKDHAETEQDKLLLRNYFGEIDLPLNVESSILPRQDNNDVVWRIDNKATFNKRGFDRKGFAKMLKNLTKVYNIDASLNVDFEESYIFIKNGTLANAELFLDTAVANWYLILTGHKLVQINQTGLEQLKEAENMAEVLEST